MSTRRDGRRSSQKIARRRACDRPSLHWQRVYGSPFWQTWSRGATITGASSTRSQVRSATSVTRLHALKALHTKPWRRFELLQLNSTKHGRPAIGVVVRRLHDLVVQETCLRLFGLTFPRQVSYVVSQIESSTGRQWLTTFPTGPKWTLVLSLRADVKTRLPFVVACTLLDAYVPNARVPFIIVSFPDNERDTMWSLRKQLEVLDPKCAVSKGGKYALRPVTSSGRDSKTRRLAGRRKRLNASRKSRALKISMERP